MTSPFGAPLYFIARNRDPYPALGQAGAGEWEPEVRWLGRRGITRVRKVNVGFLSGIPSLRQLTLKLRPGVHACGHMHHDHQARIGATQVVCLVKPHNTPNRLRGVAVAERDRRGNLRILT